MIELDDVSDDQPICMNMDEGQLVFAPRYSLTEEEKERSDLHIGSCLACQNDMDFDQFFSRLLESTWETYAGA